MAVAPCHGGPAMFAPEATRTSGMGRAARHLSRHTSSRPIEARETGLCTPRVTTGA